MNSVTVEEGYVSPCTHLRLGAWHLWEVWGASPPLEMAHLEEGKKRNGEGKNSA